MTRDELLASLRIPLMQAPMSIASTADLAEAACLAGVMGCFTTTNAHKAEGLRPWIDRVQRAIAMEEARGGRPAPLAVNINLLKFKPREQLDAEFAACREAGVMVVTTNLGDPTEAVKRVHDWGGLVIHDATTLEQAERAIAAGVDGLMLVCAGAGGLPGELSPFAFVPRVRRMFDGIIQMAGAVADGRGIAAARMLGADMVCMGTRFIATRESGAPEGHKAMLAESDVSDVMLTDRITGLPANFLRPSIRACGLDPDAIPPPVSKRRGEIPPEIEPWSMVWSGGQSLALIDDVPAVSDLVDRLEAEYCAATGQLSEKAWARA
jgi:nitronate monooxygenase